MFCTIMHQNQYFTIIVKKQSSGLSVLQVICLVYHRHYMVFIISNCLVLFLSTVAFELILQQLMHLLTRRLTASIKAGKLFYHPHQIGGKGRGGGVYSVKQSSTVKYANYIRNLSKTSTSRSEPLLREVRDFQETIEGDPVIRMCIQGSLDTLARANDPSVPLTGYTIDQVMRDINTVATTPPQFENKEIIGVPFSILFFGLLNNYYGQGFFGNPKVNHHLKKIFNVYGTMLHSLKSQECLNQVDGWLSPQARKFVEYKDFIHDPNDEFYGYGCWNDWFVRQLAPGARIIDDKVNRVVNSSDSYCLENPLQPVANVQAVNSFWLKDDNYSLYDMFGVAQMGQEIKSIVDQSFVGGTVYQAFLSPWCYHRWHAPYGGILEKTYKLPGTYLLSNPTLDLSNSGQDNYVNTQPLLTSLSVRHVYIINTPNPEIGRIGIIEIGMGEVSSCISTVNQGDNLAKGQQLGRFEFGGSSHAIIFDKKAKLRFNKDIYLKDPQTGDPVLQKVGTWLAETI